jgi:metal-responsive CopG/Arc/MetJ family transcriptional regulator
MKRFTINLPDELHARFKSFCALQGKEMTEVVQKFIQEYVEKAEKKSKK